MCTVESGIIMTFLKKFFEGRKLKKKVNHGFGFAPQDPEGFCAP